MKKNSIFLLISLGIRLATFSQGEDDHWISLYGPPINGDKPLANCFRLPDPQCNFFLNNNFNRSGYDPTIVQHYQDPFHNNLIPDWMAGCGSPNVYDGVHFNDPPPNISTGYAGMGSWFFPDVHCEGIAQKLPMLTAGDSYGMSFFKKRKIYADPQLNNWIDNFYIVLMHCEDYSSLTPILYDPPPLPQNSQVIYCERAVRNTSWEQVIFNFIPDDDYDMAIMYVQQDPTSPPSGKFGYLLMSFPEILENSGNFSAGISPTTGNCHVTIGPNPLNCAFANSQFTWTDPNGVIVYQGPNQTLELDMNSAAPGNYTLTMNVPGAVVSVPTNSCSVASPPTASATVYVPPPTCNCTGLQIVLPNVEYWNIQPSNNQNMNFVQDLSTCSLNNLCFGKTDDLPFIFNLSSNQTSGNIWEARIVAVAPFTYGGNAGGTFNNSPIPYPYSGSYYTFGTGQNAQLEMNGFMAPREIFIVEIKLSNSLLGQSKILQIRNVPLSIVYQSDFWCVPYSPAANYPHKVIMGVDALGGNSLDIPGYTYQWTFPQGMTMITGTNNLHVEWDDANFDFINNPNPIASLYVTNIYGCSDFTQVINIAPQYCTSARTPFVNSGNSKERDEGTRFTGKDKAVIFPNPASATVNISSNGNFVEASIQSGDGRIIGRFLISGRMHQLDVSHLAKGVYLLMLKKRDGTNEVHKIVKH